jgi:hypothetical protein
MYMWGKAIPKRHNLSRRDDGETIKKADGEIIKKRDEEG